MLRLITYLSPSIPAALYELIARELGAELTFEETISGPLAGDDEPFSRGEADLGFFCAPSFRFLNSGRRLVDLLPLPVPRDARAGGRPVYFSDVVVPEESPFRTFDDLRGQRWAYNDRNSKSGWFSMLGRITPNAPDAFFASLLHSGSHVRSLELITRGEADAAAIDSNVLGLHRQSHPGLRVLESWGPFPIQPVIIRSSMPASVKARIATKLLTLHERHPKCLERFGIERFVSGAEADYL
jgi:ABC-type phosphate/phosphonate transport system substrate-binding protein